MEKWKDNKYSLGRNLYFYLPLFMNPRWIENNEFAILLQEYNYCKEFNIPLAGTLDEADAQVLEEFGTIRNEIVSIEKYMSEQNGK